MSQQEFWQWVHYNYGEDLGLTSDDDADYVSLTAVDRIQFQMRIQREEKLSQQYTDSLIQPVDTAASKVSFCLYQLHCRAHVSLSHKIKIDIVWSVKHHCILAPLLASNSHVRHRLEPELQQQNCLTDIAVIYFDHST